MGDLLGAVLELDVGSPAHGGACVARHEGRVVFVRHALPGERVRARVTEERDSYCRADAIEIRTASPERVVAPCPYAGPGRCGGCDWQHASAAAQQAMKGEIVREQFARIARLDVASVFAGVEPLPGGLLGWRTRIAYAVDEAGRPGLHRHRSAEIEHVSECLLGVEGVGDTGALRETWPGLIAVEAARGDEPDVALLAHRPGAGRQARGRRPPDRVELLEGPPRLRHTVHGRGLEVSAGGFWQIHPAAAATFAQAVLDGVRPTAGERALDLYAGAGALTVALAAAVGETGAVVGLETVATAVADANANLAELPWAEVRQARVSAATLDGIDLRPDIVVLDPPRAGAGAEVMSAILALASRTVGYVSCDAGALARDVAVAVGEGWQLSELRAFDAFPMTQHIECVATLQRPKDRAAP